MCETRTEEEPNNLTKQKLAYSTYNLNTILCLQVRSGLLTGENKYYQTD